MNVLRLTRTALGSAILAGLAVVSATVLAVRTIHTPAADSELGPSFYLLIIGTACGVAAAGVVAWMLLAPIASTYRRGGLALVSAFATILLMLVCMPVDQLWGRAGLAGLAVTCAGAAALLGRRARQTAHLEP